MGKTWSERVEKSTTALREEEILEFWKRENIFKKSLDKDAEKGEYVFYDGPPFATGTPHYGHLVASAMKDAIPRYFTMAGFRVQRQWGWDCHGLPIENIVEKELGTSGKKDIVAMGVKKFNDLCREKIFTYVDIWNAFIPRFGRWADMQNPYRTMDKNFMESEWWAFKTLFDKGLIYEDYRTMHICPRCETTLAQSEVAEGYKIIKDLAVTCEFPMKDDPNTVFLAWTTTPWTLPGNVALAVGADIAYSYVQKEGNPKHYIVADKRIDEVFKNMTHTIIKTVSGKELVGAQYIPPFSAYTNKEFPKKDAAWKVYAADFVTDDSGTGIAHEAPAFGAEDMQLAQQVGLPLIQHVGMDGRIAPEVQELAGLSVKPHDDVQSTDVAVIKYLAVQGLLFAKEKYEHSYPHCWRCDTPLINYATSSWFVAVQKIKEPLLEYAKQINWSPTHVKDGRWGEWLKGAKDWSISRQRFWANTMPVWRCATCKKIKVYGSVADLEKDSAQTITDLHKDVVDTISVPCDCGGVMNRIPDVLDTWFNSGSVPFAVHHYPFENKDALEKRIPADFIAEGQDQVSKWFYYQHVISGGVFEKPAFKNVLVNGIVLAEDGKKMSKRLKNYPDPNMVIDQYGADATRLYLLSSPVVRAENLNFAEAGVAELSRKVIGRLVNVYDFYALYKDSIAHIAADTSPQVLDQWIIARMRDMHARVTKGYEAYELDVATRPLIDFVEDLSTWYLRRSRDRIKDANEDAAHALGTLAWILKEYAKVAAPAMPFIADWLWEKLWVSGDESSVHLAAWSHFELKTENSQLISDMEKIRAMVTIGLEMRAGANVKVRQPLSRFTINLKNFAVNELHVEQYAAIIKDELNVKQVVYADLQGVPASLDTTITPELALEGEFRDLLRAIQGERKNMGLNPGDAVVLSIDPNLKNIVEPFRAELSKTANIVDITFGEQSGTLPFALTKK